MSQVKGVYKCGKKWKSQIQVNGKQHYLGIFDTVEQAQESYQVATLRFRGKAVGIGASNGSGGKRSGDGGSSSSSAGSSSNNNRTSRRGSGSGLNTTVSQTQAAVAVSGESGEDEGETEDDNEDDEGHSLFAGARPIVLRVQNQAEKAAVEAKVRLGLILNELLAANNDNNNMTDTDIEKYYTELTQLLTTLRYVRN